MTLTVIILTRDEEEHIARAIDSVAGIADEVLVVDSGSTDRTVEIARSRRARVITNTWINYATQFNTALKHIGSETEWVMRLDADEVMEPDLAAEIRDRLPGLGREVAGVRISRRMCFLGRPVRRGGVFPIRVVRLFRVGQGRVEERWMDEHVRLDGPAVDFAGCIVDDNRKPISWWIEKHNLYASREAIDILNAEFGFMPRETISGTDQAATKRWIKEKIYARLPGGFRAGVYFFYRYVVRLGMLDGPEGRSFHILQGFWYRYLVDAKVREARRYISGSGVSPVRAIAELFHIDVSSKIGEDSRPIACRGELMRGAGE